MKCVIDFLHDNYQENLRNYCQNQSEKYEEALMKYKNTFITEINLIKSSKGLCEKHKNHKFGNKLFDFIKNIDVTELSEFFDEMIQIYICWINTEGQKSLERLEKILAKFEILDFKLDINEYVFFRGRISDNILTPWDMFHIPFNKRYLISNQRFSLTGQPLVYLGCSVLDVVAELGINLDNFNNIKISTYRFNNNFNVYDLRNEFYKYLNYDEASEYMDSNNLDKLELKDEDLKKEFYKLIISSICSFEKRKEHHGYSFCEEYVIPQLLAQIIKKNNLKGIIYSSTKLKSKENDELYNTIYKDNVAIFTNFSKEHSYDRGLYKKVNISNPMSYEKIKCIDLKDIKYICTVIEELDKNKKYNDYYYIGDLLEENFINIEINKNKYFTHNIGKMHMYLIYSLLMSIRNECLMEG